jgi:hypothetical protein
MESPEDPIVFMLNQRIQGSDPDEFMLQCRRALVDIVAHMPAKQAQYVYQQVSMPCPYATAAEHQDWINSVHYKALQLEVQYKLDELGQR